VTARRAPRRGDRDRTKHSSGAATDEVKRTIVHAGSLALRARDVKARGASAVVSRQALDRQERAARGVVEGGTRFVPSN